MVLHTTHLSISGTDSAWCSQALLSDTLSTLAPLLLSVGLLRAEINVELEARKHCQVETACFGRGQVIEYGTISNRVYRTVIGMRAYTGVEPGHRGTYHRALVTR